MSARTLVKPALGTRWTASIPLPPTFLLPWRARLHQATASTPVQNAPPQISSHTLRTSPSPPVTASTQKTPSKPLPSSNPSPEWIKSPPSSAKRLVLSNSVQALLPLLQAQKPHYISAHIHRFPYVVTEGDTLRLPFHMHGVEPGDVLRLNRASLLGSRDYTLKAGTMSTETYDAKRTGQPNYLDERLYECRARVLGVDSGPMMKKVKTKRRQRRVKTVTSKHKYTVLKVMEVKIKSLEELRTGTDNLLLG